MNTDPRVAVVTGGCGGIGRATSDALAADGFWVEAWDLPEAIENSTICDEDQTRRIRTRPVDMGEETSVSDAVAATVNDHGRIDVLVNNAAISPHPPHGRWDPEEVPTDEWDAVLRVNLTGPFIASRAAIPHMKRQGWGRLVNISSKASRTGARRGGLAYGVAKTGLNGMTRTLAHDLAPFGITVNAIAPGRIETAMTAYADDETRAAIIAAIPVGRSGDGRDIAGAISYLCSEAAGFVTGVTLDVNGGAFMAP